MSRFRVNNFYSTGFNSYNFYLAAGSTTQLEISSGNMDTAVTGVAYITVYGSGAPLGMVFSNVRMEGVTSKRLIYVNSGTSGGFVKLYGCVATNGVAEALIYVNGTTVTAFADVTFQNSPQYWLKDVRGGTFDIPFVSNRDAPKKLN